MRILALALLLSALAAPAHAQFLTGKLLQEYLDEAQAGTSFAKRAIAIGYVAGIHDAVSGRKICAEATFTAEQSMEIVDRYLRAHPERLAESAAVLVIQALSESFPCRK